MAAGVAASSPRYEPHERPPFPVSLGLALQTACLGLTPRVLFPLIVVQASGGSSSQAAWMVFATLLVSSVTTVLQTRRVGPIGVGCITISNSSSVSVPFCILALSGGGLATLAALVLVSGLFQIVVSRRLSLLRRLVTPTVNGTIVMLMSINLMSVAFSRIGAVREGRRRVLCAPL